MSLSSLTGLAVAIVGVASSLTAGFFKYREIRQLGRDKTAQAQTTHDAAIRLEARREYEERVKDSFVYAVATNHLPHVFHALELIAKHLGIELPDPPPIQFLPFEARDSQKR